MATIPTLYESTIILPHNALGEIDYDFMESRIRELEESRIRELEESRIRELEEYLNVSGLSDCELSPSEEQVLHLLEQHKIKTALFPISDLYDKVQLKNKNFDKRKDTSPTPNNIFSVPLVNAKHGNNGIMFYGKGNIFPSVEMTIDIVQNGAIATGDVYAQPQKTGVLWDAYLIKAKNRHDTENSLLFIACSIQKTIKLRFSYDKKAVWDRVKTQSISLPITESGNIDFEIIETCISALKKRAIQSLKTFIRNEHNAYISITE